MSAAEVNRSPATSDFLNVKFAAIDRDSRTVRDADIAERERAGADNNTVHAEVAECGFRGAIDAAADKGFGVAVADHMFFAVRDCASEVKRLTVERGIHGYIFRRNAKSIVQTTGTGRGIDRYDVACNMVFN